MWELLKRHKINPHPSYPIGWNRCSCATCIFSTPSFIAGLKGIYPHEFAELKRDEEVLGFTIENKKNLDDYICNAKSCLCRDDKQAINSILTGEFDTGDIYVKGWHYLAGAFYGVAFRY